MVYHADVICRIYLHNVFIYVYTIRNLKLVRDSIRSASYFTQAFAKSGFIIIINQYNYMSMNNIKI